MKNKKPALRKDVYVMGVRGPRTRDAFLLKYGVNPEVLGDPGLYLYELFHALVDKERNNASRIHGIVPTLSKSMMQGIPV